MNTPSGDMHKNARNIEMFDTDAFVDMLGIPRWKSNNRVPFDDMLQTWLRAGKQFDYEAATMKRNQQSKKFIAEHKISQAERTSEQIAEERAMARGEFGPGESVVNVITGERYTT
jgi:hypothetical protein